MKCPKCGIAGALMKNLAGEYECLSCGTTKISVGVLSGAVHPDPANASTNDDLVTDTFDGETLHYLCGRRPDRFIPDLKFNVDVGLFQRWLHRRDSKLRNHRFDA